MPGRRSRRRVLLDKIAQGFEPGVRYPEHRVSQFLGAIYADLRIHSPLRGAAVGCDNWVPSRRRRVRLAGGWGRSP